MEILFQSVSDNHEITIYDTVELCGDRGRFRVLQFANGDMQGAMDLDRPERVLFEYPRAMIHLMETNRDDFSNVFIIGHGIGTIAGYYTDKKRIKVAELDAQVVELSRKYFGYRSGNVVVGDGRSLLEAEAPQSYDYILLDAFNSQGTPRHLTSLEFFRTAQEKLDPDHGAVILNLMGKNGQDKLVSAIHSTLLQVFTYTQAFILPTKGSTGAADVRNIVLMGSCKPIQYQLRQMAGFQKLELVQGYVITD